jgi:hypothetical protein
MSRAASTAAWLWILLAVIVFNVTFDWHTRMAGHAFIAAQYQRHRAGQPPLSLDEGFRPMVRDAALRASLWLMVIGAGGLAATRVAARRSD